MVSFLSEKLFGRPLWAKGTRGGRPFCFLIAANASAWGAVDRLRHILNRGSIRRARLLLDKVHKASLNDVRCRRTVFWRRPMFRK